VEEDTKIKKNAELFWHLVYFSKSEYNKHRLFEARGRKLAMCDVLEVSKNLFVWREGEVLLSPSCCPACIHRPENETGKKRCGWC
jgi:hypothetical protein